MSVDLEEKIAYLQRDNDTLTARIDQDRKHFQAKTATAGKRISTLMKQVEKARELLLLAAQSSGTSTLLKDQIGEFLVRLEEDRPSD